MLAGLGAAGVVCLPVATGVSETPPSNLTRAEGYPLRIALPSAEPEILADALVPEEPETEALAEETAEAATPADEDTAELAASRTVEKPAPAAAQRGVLLSLQYDLGDPSTASIDDAASAPVEIAKLVRVNGADVGRATIRVTSGTTLLIARDEVVSLLETSGHPDMAKIVTAGAPGSFISFEELRRRGMNVRYDAAADRIARSS